MRQCITIGPGGMLGLYMLGTMMYLKNFYKIDNYKIGGSSAGAVVALYALSGHTDDRIMEKCIDPLITSFVGTPNAWKNMPKLLLENLSPMTHKIDHTRAFISISTFKTYFPFYGGNIIETFDDSNHLMQTAVASAYIPILCGGLSYECEDGEACFDGALYTNNPIPENCEQILHITPSIWGRDFTGMDTVKLNSKNDLKNMIIQGYWDAHENKEFLDKHLIGRYFPTKILNRIKLNKIRKSY